MKTESVFTSASCEENTAVTCWQPGQPGGQSIGLVPVLERASHFSPAAPPFKRLQGPSKAGGGFEEAAS